MRKPKNFGRSQHNNDIYTGKQFELHKSTAIPRKHTVYGTFNLIIPSKANQFKHGTTDRKLKPSQKAILN